MVCIPPKKGPKMKTASFRERSDAVLNDVSARVLHFKKGERVHCPINRQNLPSASKDLKKDGTFPPFCRVNRIIMNLSIGR